MRPPLGHFTPRQPFRDSVFIATGTGVVPVRAMLQAEPVRSAGASVTLLFGARLEESILFRDEFEALAGAWSAFRFWPTLTRPGAGWTGRAGRVQQHLDEALGGRLDLDVYVCGLKAMVNDVRENLKSRGFSRPQIVYEKYD
jgi:CDP-4-dehydro-6-deoxyglucose reductase